MRRKRNRHVVLAHNDLAVVFLVVVNQSVVVCARASLVALFVYVAARSRPVAIHDVPRIVHSHFPAWRRTPAAHTNGGQRLDSDPRPRRDRSTTSRRAARDTRHATRRAATTRRNVPGAVIKVEVKLLNIASILSRRRHPAATGNIVYVRPQL